LAGPVRVIGTGEAQVFVTRLLLNFELKLDKGENLESAPMQLVLSPTLAEAAASLARNAPVFIHGALTPRSAFEAFKVRRGRAGRTRRPAGYVIEVDDLQLTGEPEEWITHPHASPEPHQVTRHPRTLANGVVVQVRSYWTGRKRLDPSS